MTKETSKRKKKQKTKTRNFKTDKRREKPKNGKHQRRISNKHTSFPYTPFSPRTLHSDSSPMKPWIQSRHRITAHQRIRFQILVHSLVSFANSLLFCGLLMMSCFICPYPSPGPRRRIHDKYFQRPLGRLKAERDRGAMRRAYLFCVVCEHSTLRISLYSFLQPVP
jgi:hypothetical protein